MIAVLLGLVGLAATCVALVFATRPAIPPAPFSEADLPALPGSADNAWSLFDDADLQPSDAPPGRSLLEARRGPPRVQALWEHADELNDYEISEALATAIEAGRSRPRMVIDCPLSLLVPCSTVAWLEVHRAILAHCLHLLIDGEHVEATELSTWLVRADHDLITHGRTLLGLALAQVTLRDAVELAALVGAAIGAAPERPEQGVGAALDTLELAIASMTPDEWTLEDAVTGEAISMRSALSAEFADGDIGRLAIWLDQETLAARAYARDPAHRDPPVPAEPGWLWRLTDPDAIANTETLTYDVEERQRGLDEFRASILERIEVARVSIRAGRARATLASATSDSDAPAPPSD